jgi:hypothetical protein
MALAPGAMQLISLSELQKQGLLPADQPWTAATVSFSGDPSDLVALTASYNDDGRYGLQSPFSYSVAPHWKGGRWRVGDEYNTLGYR